MILIIILIALVLRLVNLNQSLWLDEAVQAITAKASFSYIFQEITGDFHPPLYYFLMHFWIRVFGSSEIALRMPSVLFGVGTVFILYKIAMHMHYRFVAILAALFLATSPFHIYYSQEVRMYSMVTFFAALSMYFFVTLDKSKKNKYLYFFSTVLMIYSDYYGFLVLLAQMIYLATKRNYKFLLICLFAYLLIYLPWLPMLIVQLKTGSLASQTLPGWGKLVNVAFWKAVPLTFIKFTIGRITIFDKRIYGIVSTGIILFIGWIFLKGFGYQLSGKNKNQKPVTVNRSLIAISLWFFVPLIVSWLASLFVPNFQPFRLLLILPAFYLLIGIGVDNSKTSILRCIEVIVLVVVNLISLSVYYFNPYFYREDWRGVVSFLKKQNTTIILPSETSNWPIKYYDQQNKLQVIYGGKGVRKINTSDNSVIGDQLSVISNGEKLYYIRYLVPLFDSKELILLSLKEKRYTKTNILNFNQIEIWEYQRSNN